MDELYTLMFQHGSNKKCATLIVTETRPKITALEFQGNLVERTWYFKFSFIKTCHIELQLFVDIAGEKLFSKRLWHRLRPPAVVVLDVHRGLRRQQQLGALHAAVECCPMQRSPTSAPQASEAPPAAAPRGFWAPGPWLSRTCTAAPFARRKATTAVWSNRAARCSAAQRPSPTTSKSRSRQRRSPRRWPRTAARSPWRAASAMWSSRRGEKCSRNEVPQFLRSLCFIFSKSKSATYGNYIE